MFLCFAIKEGIKYLTQEFIINFRSEKFSKKKKELKEQARNAKP